MKTSNLILTIGAGIAVASMTITLAIGSSRALTTNAELTPFARQLDTTTIHIVKELNSDPMISLYRSKQTKSLKISSQPSVGDFTIVGDTLVVDVPYSVVIGLPDVTHLLTADGTLHPVEATDD